MTITFSWTGKEEALAEAFTPLDVDLDSEGDGDNLFFEMDNLVALKWLKKNGYKEKIKMIYIDPPHNTRKKRYYHDTFKHHEWLNIMYPRLVLARELLKEDGVIFISIDDNEQARLKLLCDKIFGERNFVANVPVIMNLKGNNDAFCFSETHEYILVYAKRKASCCVGQYLVSVIGEEEWCEDEHGLYKRADPLRRTGQNAPRESRPLGWFPIFIRSDNSLYVTENDQPASSSDIALFPVSEDGEELSWTWSKPKIVREKHNLLVIEGRKGKNIYKKARPKLGDMHTTKPKSVLYAPEYSTSTATKNLKKLMDKKVFHGAKPIPLIKDLLAIGCVAHLCAPYNDIILDFFAGSGTTAHAVMQLNAEDGGNRRYICVQIPEPCKEGSEAFKAGYKTIADICKERIRRAGAKINPESNTDFRVFTERVK